MIKDKDINHGKLKNCHAKKWSQSLRVVKSSQLPAKITTYSVSIGRLLCLAFLYGWRFLNKMSLEWLLTLTTQPSTSKLSDNPGHLQLWSCMRGGRS